MLACSSVLVHPSARHRLHPRPDPRPHPHPHHSTPEPTPEPEPEPYQAQRARFAELGARFAERTRQLSEPSAVDESALLKAARQTAETAPLLEWLRLLASACMQVR